MGVNHVGLRAILVARAAGADFKRTVTLGHQELHVDEHELERCFRAFGVPFEASDIHEIARHRFADRLFVHLGAENVDAIDASPYERATIIHDMNRPLPPAMERKYSAVVDCGTLEHVFDFPAASKNFISLAETGGHLISVVPANNLCGHGFYQFSPELFFRVFGPENGCEIVSMLVAESLPGLAWHEVTDPNTIHRRVLLYSARASLLVMLARRRSEAMDPAFCPQQSDYAEGMWQEADAAAPDRRKPALVKSLAGRLPPLALGLVMDARNRFLRSGYGAGFRRVIPERMTFPRT